MNNDELFRNNLANLTAWFKVVDFNNPFTLEDFSYESGVPENGVGSHCWKCITVNQCYFKNEPNKKPEEFDYSTIIIPKFARGIYHPNCECKKLGYAAPHPHEVKLLNLNTKYEYFFHDKIHWYHSWGYKDYEKEEFKKVYESLIKAAYCKGDYIIREHDNTGAKITVFITLPGANDKFGKSFKLKAGYTIFPNKKLKCNTPIGGK